MLALILNIESGIFMLNDDIAYQYSILENDEIGVKVEMHDSDDEPLTKIIKLS